ncbi:aldo/keto reductase [Actinoallomurus sp. NBC_01490]|uniref:aldo/keto reductase n=1 Tax=Actinoallomurus sp. NBC_01490 TaxID=2903557 RepID=UPI002E33528E|nr:aldo/keto reductase [Actinoallomurus sp. NBC_01490]
MEQRHLGTLTTSALGLGCMGLSQGYGPADDERSVRVIRTALDLGVRMLDTAMSYGQGHNERLIARAIAGRRDEALLATKFGIVRGPDGVRVDARPERVRADCEASLARLGTDVIDLYYLHRADPRVPIGETVAAMAELVQAGKVRHLGLSEVTADQLEQAAAVHPIAAVQLEWSLLWRRPEADVVPAARRHGIGVVPYSPLGRGLLTGSLTEADIRLSDFRRADPRFQGGNLAANRRQVAALRRFAEQREISPGRLALAWLLAQGSDVVPIPGTRSPDRLADNAHSADIHLGPADLRELDELLRADGWAGDRRSFAVPVTARHAPAPARATGSGE